MPRKKERERSELNIKLAWRKSKKKRVMKNTRLSWQWIHGELKLFYLPPKTRRSLKPPRDPYRAARQFERFLFGWRGFS